MHCRYEGRIWNFLDHCYVGDKKRPARCSWASHVTVAIWGLTGLRLAGASPVCPFACLPVRPPARPSRRSLARQLARPPVRPPARGFANCTEYGFRHGRPSMYRAVSVSLGLPIARASLILTISRQEKPLAYICSSWKWASRIVGLPKYIPYGLRHGPASTHLTVYLSPGLPHCRASLTHIIRPPTQTGFHVSLHPTSRPASTPPAICTVLCLSL